MPGHFLQRAMGVVCLCVLLSLPPAPARADAQRCEAAAQRAALDTGVSLALLRAIMLAESGQDQGQGRAPWPWTLQSGGQGEWLVSPDAVLRRVADLTADGTTNVDIGCFQINLHWHGAAFDSVEAMLDPDANALYAARFLADLRVQTGDWRSAAGAYHSRNADRAEAYVARLVRLHAESRGPAGQDGPAPDRAAPPDPVAMADAGHPSGRVLVAANGPLVRLGALAAPLIGGLR